MVPQPDAATLTLPAIPASVRTARRFVAEHVAGFSAPVAANAVLLTSEIATNCVVHGRTDFVVRVVVDERGVRVEVADDDPGLPCIDQQEGRRGLRIVQQVAAAWGVERRPDADGKVVWFEVRAD